MYMRIPHFVHSLLAMQALTSYHLVELRFNTLLLTTVRALSEYLHFEIEDDHTISCAGKRGMLK
jgi:hypothetical protein